MAFKAYISNISRAWPAARQREIIGPGGTEYEDVVKKTVLKRRDPASLKERATMLRPTARKTPQTIRVAALPCLAWTWLDFVAVMAAASARNATIVSASSGLEVPPNPDMATVHRAMTEFASAKLRAQTEPGREKGRAAAAALVVEDTKRRLALIEADWSRREYSTADLLARAGRGKRPMAHATAVKALGKRAIARALYESKQEKTK